LLQKETPEFIPPQLWPQTCQIDYRVWGLLQDLKNTFKILNENDDATNNYYQHQYFSKILKICTFTEINIYTISNIDTVRQIEITQKGDKFNIDIPAMIFK